MGGERVICADGERVNGWGAVGDGVCGGAADYGDGEDGAGEGGDWGGMCFFSFLLFFSFSKLKAFSHSLFFSVWWKGGREDCIFSWDWEVLWGFGFMAPWGPSLDVSFFGEKGFPT